MGVVTLDDRLENIETMLRTSASSIANIAASISQASTEVALIKAKLDLHDKILMGVCGIVGTAVVGALVTLVVRSQP